MKTLPDKPSKGSDCSGCGVCCIAETCAVGLEAFGNSHQVCPALYWSENQFRCGLMQNLFSFIFPEQKGEYLNPGIHHIINI